jgi:hypothetical protein
VAGSPARLAAACLVAVLAFSAFDVLLFRSGLYAQILDPDSTAGLFELILRREQDAQQRYGDNVVITFGDSRFAYSPKQCNALSPQSGLVFRNAGVAGSDIPAWYFMLRDLDPSASRYRAIVFGVSDFGDDDDTPDGADDARTLHYVINRLRMADVLTLPRMYGDPELRVEALRGGLWKGFVLARDVRDFLAAPRQRLDYVRLCREGFEQWTYDFEESTANMVGLRVDWEKGTATFPPGMSEDQLGTVNAHITPLPRVTHDSLGEFRREWFGRILQRYRGSRTRIVFLRLPRGPIPPPEKAWPSAAGSIRQLARQPGVLLCGEHAFDFLERPELFKDGAHLNRDGIARFSPRLVQEIGQLLAASPGH